MRNTTLTECSQQNSVEMYQTYLTKYDVCSICCNYKFFQPLRAKWCNQYKHDCGVCDTTFCKKNEIVQALKNSVER